jgi:hypothetical protein
MKKTKKPPKEIPECDQVLIAELINSSVRSIVPLIEGQFLTDFETSFIVEDTVYSLKLEKKLTPKQFTKKAIIFLAIMLSLAAILLITTHNAIQKAPLWFHALFGFMVPGFIIYLIDLLKKWFKIPFIIKYLS